MVRCEKAETEAWNFVLKLYENREDFERRLRLALEMQEQQLAPKRERLTTVEQVIAECEREIDDYARDIHDTPDGKLKQALRRQADEVEARCKAHIRERDRLVGELSEAQITEETIQHGLKFRDRVILGMENPTFDDKQQVFELLQVQVTVTNRKATVECGIPLYAIATHNSGRVSRDCGIQSIQI